MLLRLIPLLALLSVRLLADVIAYGDKRTIEIESASYQVSHTHDWSRSSQLVALSLADDAAERIFGPGNHIASLRVLRRSDSTVLIDTPSPAFTRLWISPDETLLVGLSRVKIHNPVQLAVWELPSGRLLWREHIASDVFLLSAEALAAHNRDFPESVAYLRAFSRPLRQSGGNTVVDLHRLGAPNKLGDRAWRALYAHQNAHPYSPNFSESVTNWVNWYREPDPSLRVEKSRDGRTRLSLLDPQGIRIAILLPLEGEALPGPSPETPFPPSDIRLSTPGDVRIPLDEPWRLGAASAHDFVVLNPEEGGRLADSNQLEQTLRGRLRFQGDYTLFKLDPDEQKNAELITRHVARVVPELNRELARLLATRDLAQLVGVEADGRRLVLVNVIPMSGRRSANVFWLWHDGGPRIFQLLVDPHSGEIVSWQFNWYL